MIKKYLKTSNYVAVLKGYYTSWLYKKKYEHIKEDASIKFSVIIPTLQKSPYLSALIEFFLHNESVEEVILINNATDQYIHTHNFTHKLVIIGNGVNNYVNPSWNKGVALAKTPYVVLSNDDIIIKKDPFPLLNKFMQLDGVGIVGCNFILEDKKILKTGTCAILPFGVSNCEKRPVGFGCFMAFRKDNYYHIPDDMKIFFGDDYILHQNLLASKKNFAICLPYFETEISLTSSEEKFNNYMQEDKEIFLASINNA